MMRAITDTLCGLYQLQLLRRHDDRGSGVREKAKQLIEMLTMTKRLEDRHNKQLRERLDKRLVELVVLVPMSGALAGGTATIVGIRVVAVVEVAAEEEQWWIRRRRY
jgi:hypothetical protein